MHVATWHDLSYAVFRELQESVGLAECMDGDPQKIGLAECMDDDDQCKLSSSLFAGYSESIVCFACMSAHESMI